MKHNSQRKNQIILLMITDGDAVKNLSVLFKEIISKNKGDFYCLNCPCSFRTENELKIHENVCKNHDYCHTEMPEKSKNILKYNHGEKSC